jgi:LPXTG-motif cell wall-anchored protein
VTPDGRFLYVVNSMGGTLSKIDLTTPAVVETIAVNPNPSRMAIGPAGCVSEQPSITPTTSIAPATTVTATLPTTGSGSDDGSSAGIGILLIAVGGVLIVSRRVRYLA